MMFGKLLKDYQFNAWMEAADGCEECGAKYQVRIVYIDKERNFGDVEFRVAHKLDCAYLYEYGATQEGWDVAGWTFKKKPFQLEGKRYYPLASRANIVPCLECGRLVIGIPLILWIEEGREGELDFCFDCAEKLDLLNKLKEAKT